MDFAEWSYSFQVQLIYISICISIPSAALYIAEIVTIVRHKEFRNSFYDLFVMRAIPDLLFLLNSYYGQRLPYILGVLYPIYSNFPNWMRALYFYLNGHTFQSNLLATTFILLNRLTAIIMPLKHEKKVSINGTNNGDELEKKLMIYALATFLGHSLVASHFVITDIWLVDYPKIRFMMGSYYPLFLDTGIVVLSSCLLLWASGTFRQQLLKDFGIIRINNVQTIRTVMLSSWLLLWASSTFRQQLIKDFSIIRKTNIQNNRVGPMDGPRNNNHRPVGGAVGHQLQTRFSSSVQQLPTVS
ncbi:hypothetical protein GPALN_005974 [Globodera pallida]|nr:hypothetical protein GPALN_005974 [Globodera pallida]